MVSAMISGATWPALSDGHGRSDPKRDRWRQMHTKPGSIVVDTTRAGRSLVGGGQAAPRSKHAILFCSRAAARTVRPPRGFSHSRAMARLIRDAPGPTHEHHVVYRIEATRLA